MIHSRARSWLLGISALGFCSALASAQTDLHLLLDDWTESKRVQAQSDSQLFPRSSIGGGDSTQLNRVATQARARLDPTLPLSPSIGVDWTHIELSSGTRLPNQLDDLSLAVGSPLFSDGAWFGGGAVGIGYAGDEAFAADNSWYGKANAFVGKDLGHDRTLLFAVEYDGNRSLLPDVPLPSVIYAFKPRPDLDLAIGFPAAGFEWKPTDRWTLSGEYDVPDTIVISAKFQLLPRLALQARYVSDDDAFHVNDFGEHERIFYEDNRIEAGTILTLFGDTKLDTAVGYAWDRKFETGFDDRQTDTVADLDSQIYLRLGLTVEF